MTTQCLMFLANLLSRNCSARAQFVIVLANQRATYLFSTCTMHDSWRRYVIRKLTCVRGPIKHLTAGTRSAFSQREALPKRFIQENLPRINGETKKMTSDTGKVKTAHVCCSIELSDTESLQNYFPSHCQ